MCSSSISTWLCRLLDLDVSHVDFLVHEQNWRPFTFFSPVLRVGGFIDVDQLNIGVMVSQPIPATFVEKSHEITFAVMLVFFVGTVIVVAFVKDDPSESIFACRL